MPLSLKLISGLAVGLLLTGCTAFEPNYVDCPDTKLREGSDYVTRLGEIQGDRITMRILKVAWRCIGSGENLEMQIGFNVDVVRETDDTLSAERVPLDVTFAFLDTNDNVVSRIVHTEIIEMPGLRTYVPRTPVVEFDVPAGTRVVFGLGRAE